MPYKGYLNPDYDFVLLLIQGILKSILPPGIRIRNILSLKIIDWKKLKFI